MNEKYPFGICHACNCAISIPGSDNYFCRNCGKWIAYPKTKHKEPTTFKATRTIIYRLPLEESKTNQDSFQKTKASDSDPRSTNKAVLIGQDFMNPQPQLTLPLEGGES
jgi:hypothetical protein